MKKLRASIHAAEARIMASKIEFTQHYGEFKDHLKSVATSKKSFFLVALSGAALGYLSGAKSFASQLKNKFSRRPSFSWVGSISKLLLPYITGTLLGTIQTFLNRRAPKESEPQPEE